MIFLITYDKKVLLKNYTALNEAIKSFGTWWHHMDNTWMIQTNNTATEVFNILAPHVSVNDRLLIIEVNKNYQGWLKKEAWVWLNERFEAEENKPWFF